MVNMWNVLCLRVYLTVQSFVHDLRDDERGLSDAVTTILLVLAGVLAVALIWGWLSGWLGELWERITKTGDKIG